MLALSPYLTPTYLFLKLQLASLCVLCIFERRELQIGLEWESAGTGNKLNQKKLNCTLFINVLYPNSCQNIFKFQIAVMNLVWNPSLGSYQITAA